MKKGTAFLGLALATIMAFSIAGTSEAQTTPPKGLTTKNFTPYQMTFVTPVEDRRTKKPVTRGKKQAFWLETRWVNPELPETFNPYNKKHVIKKRRFIVRIPNGGKHACTRGCSH